MNLLSKLKLMRKRDYQKEAQLQAEIRAQLCDYGIVDIIRQDEFMDRMFKTLGVIK